MSKYSEAELAGLTDEERDGLNELEAETAAESAVDVAGEGEDGSGEDTPAAEAAAGEAAKETAGEEPAAATGPAAAAATGDAPKTDDEPAKPAEDKAEDDAPIIKRAPTYDLPENPAQAITDLKQKKLDLAEKLDNGDITAREYHEQREQADEEQRSIERKLDRARAAEDRKDEDWQTEVVSFLGQHKVYTKPGTVAYDALNAELTRLQEHRRDDGLDWRDPALLKQAHANVQRDMRRALGIEDPAAPAPPPADPAKPAPTPPKAIPAPPTLARVPASAIPEAGGDNEFAALDRLQDKDIVAYETALAKLSPEQRERYLGG